MFKVGDKVRIRSLGETGIVSQVSSVFTCVRLDSGGGYIADENGRSLNVNNYLEQDIFHAHIFKVGDKVRILSLDEEGVVAFSSSGWMYIALLSSGKKYIATEDGLIPTRSGTYKLDVVCVDEDDGMLSEGTRETLNEFIHELEAKRNIQLERKVAADKEVSALESLIEKLKKIF